MNLLPVQVPVGHDAAQWVTVSCERIVLFVAHNITTLNRLLDLFSLFDGDLRVQIVATTSFTDPFVSGLAEAIAELGLVHVPWDQATQMSFDLIVTASHHGNLTELNGPIAILSHGIGYTKYSGQQPAASSQQPAASVFGLSRTWLLRDGAPFAAALVFSHEEQLSRLAVEVPEAMPQAVLAGDPCFDRMLASVRLRGQYRAALGVDDDRVLVVVSTTWATGSLLGSGPELLRRLISELPVDGFQIALVAHPNVVRGHGPMQVRMWLADCVRAGLVLIPPLEGWRAAMIAADLVVGDHGSATTYGAALGRPVLLAAFPDDAVAPGTAVHRLSQVAPRLQIRSSLRRQVEEALAVQTPQLYSDVAGLVSSVPGESPQRLRMLFYGLLGLAEPVGEALLEVLPTDGLSRHAEPRISAMLTACDVDVSARVAAVQRFPAEGWPQFSGPTPAGRTHLVVHHAHPDRRMRANGDVVFGLESELYESPQRWCRATMQEHPACRLVAVVGRSRCVLFDRAGGRVDIVVSQSSAVDALVFASVVHTFLAVGMAMADLSPHVDVIVSGRTHRGLLTITGPQHDSGAGT